ncbi:MAG: SDR family oxidoreductase, partial [Pseudomonadota bacterium]
MTQGRFAGARVLVTGGSRGIGAAVVMAFRDAGAHVAVGGRSPQSFRHFVDRHGGDRVMAATGDVGEPDGCRAVVDTAVAGLGGLDVLVNAAGIYWEAPFEAIDTDHWNATLAVNLGAPFFCSQAALPALRQSHGSIVNIASESGLIGFPGAAAYCAAKGGLVNLTRTLALELAPHVRVNAVCPGNVDTDMMREAG